MVAPYEVFPTRDGALMIAAGNDRLFASLCDVVGLPELTGDDRFGTNPLRVQNNDALYELLAQRLSHDATAAWLEKLSAAGVPVAPVADVADIVHAPQTEALGILQPLAHPRIPGLRLAALPISFDGERALHRSAPPAIGEHSQETLREAGYDDAEIAALAADGVIRI